MDKYLTYSYTVDQENGETYVLQILVKYDDQFPPVLYEVVHVIFGLTKLWAPEAYKVEVLAKSHYITRLVVDDISEDHISYDELEDALIDSDLPKAVLKLMLKHMRIQLGHATNRLLKLRSEQQQRSTA